MESRKTHNTIYVYAQWAGMNEPVLMGELTSDFSRGREIFSFSYSDLWLKSKFSQIIDPELQLYSGTQYARNEKVNFGLFLDSSPDRWGRLLMKRREAALVRMQGNSPRSLHESDYLLGVYDGHRMGALRYKQEIDGPFLNDNKEFASPPWTSIGELEKISLILEEDDIIDSPDYFNWLMMLVNPGSSLGGARPKASITDNNNILWIAKFPAKSDDKDMGGWEMLTWHLAKNAGINVAEATIQKFSGQYHTFLTKRFDRTPNGERIHYASAMTMLGYNDGDNYREGASYLEIAEFLANNGANISNDLEELWRRIVFNIMVSNTDDHLRNHGFILTERGWILSPAFDINPNEHGTGLSLNINLDDNSLNPEIALEVIDYFRISKTRAIEIMDKVRKAVSRWRNVATMYHLSKTEKELMSPAFTRFL